MSADEPPFTANAEDASGSRTEVGKVGQVGRTGDGDGLLGIGARPHVRTMLTVASIRTQAVLVGL